MGQIRGFFRSDFSAFGAPVLFGTNLTHFGGKPTIPGIDSASGWGEEGWTVSWRLQGGEIDDDSSDNRSGEPAASAIHAIHTANRGYPGLDITQHLG